MSRTHTTYTEVEVEVDIEDVLNDLTDAELAEHGLMRVDKKIAQYLVKPDRPGWDHQLYSEGLPEHLAACASARRAS